MEIGAAMLVIALVYAVGDFVSSKTKALFSMLFVSGLLFLVGFWLGLPKTLFKDSGLVPIAMAFIPMLMIHMGSFMKLKDLKEEWRTVAIALAALVALAIALFLFASPIIGKSRAVVAAGPISGGVVATLIVSEAAKAKGLQELTVFATLLLVLQSFIGLPVASACLKREGKRALAAFRSGSASAAGPQPAKVEAKKPAWRLFPPTPQALQTQFILIMKAMLIGWIAVYVAKLFNNVVHPFVMALAFGILFYELGFLENKILEKANAAGLALFVLLVPIFMSLAQATPQMVLSLVFPIIVAFAISLVGIVAASILLGRLLGYSWELALAISSTCLFGFPGTYIISQEVANALGSNAEERDVVLNRILPKMLIGGFTTVTIASVILAGVLVKLI